MCKIEAKDVAGQFHSVLSELGRLIESANDDPVIRQGIRSYHRQDVTDLQTMAAELCQIAHPSFAEIIKEIRRDA